MIALSGAELNARLLLDLAVIVVAARLGGWVAVRCRQPRVLGEMITGVVLGPSVLGALWSAGDRYLFPAQVSGLLVGIGQLGLVVFMFLVGLELDVVHLRSQGRRAAAISITAVLAPFALGVGLAVWMHPRFAGDVSVGSFASFLGLAMAITAFPVLARVLQEAGLVASPLGALSLACAAIDDVVAWCGLAAVVAFVNAASPWDAVVALGLSVAFTAAMLLVVRPLLARLGRVPVPFAVALALGSGWVTDRIGVHAVFGAFLAGVVVPRSSRGRDELGERLELVATTVLLPVYFVVVGRSVELSRLASLRVAGVAVLIVVVAVVGKLGASSAVSRALGSTWRDSLALGVLMNTRGLTEIVILSAGLELGVIDHTVFTMMVVMAFVTTLMAGPALRRLGVAAGGAEPDRNDAPHHLA